MLLATLFSPCNIRNNVLPLTILVLFVECPESCFYKQNIYFYVSLHTIVGEELWVFERQFYGLFDDIQLAAEAADHAVCHFCSFGLDILLNGFAWKTKLGGRGQTVEGVSTRQTSRGRYGIL